MFKRMIMLWEELVRGRGSQFDPKLLDSFLEFMDAGNLEEIAEREIPVYGEKTVGSN